MVAANKKNFRVAELVVALVVVLVGGVLFMGAVAGWFEDGKVALSAEYYCEDCAGELVDLSAEEYERLASEKKSFVVVIDQSGCTTAERIKGFALRYAEEAGIKVFRMMFAEMKTTNLHEEIKYYPSFAIVENGKLRAWLKADDDADAAAYNDYDAFCEWVGRYL